MISKERKVILLILITIPILFYVSNTYLSGSMATHESLGRELKSPPDKLYEWNLSEETPFNYRLLFPLIVKSTYQLLGTSGNQSFFNIYYAYSMLFMVSAVLSFYWLLKTLNFSLQWRVVGIFLFISSPAIFLAHTIPVHTREDLLGYTFLSLGLIAIQKNRLGHYLIIAALGVLTRETLMILPFIFFFFTENSWSKKLFAVAIPSIVVVAIRLLMPAESYDTWLGLRWNLNNPEQILAFGFATFHCCWLFFGSSYISKPSNAPGLSLFIRSAPAALCLIIVTTFLFGISNEIRLLFFAFPWIIIPSLLFLRQKQTAIEKYFKTTWFILYSTVVLLIGAVAIYFGLSNVEKLINPGKYAVPYDIWLTVFIILGAITLILTPIVINFIRQEISNGNRK